LANRVNLRVGLVTDQKLIKAFKKSTGWFENEASFNTIILKRYDGEIFKFDLFNVGNGNAHSWISRKTVKEVEQMDEELFQVYNDIGLPILLGFVDFGRRGGSSGLVVGKTQKYQSIEDKEKAIEESKRLVEKVLPGVARTVFKAFVVCYADIADYGDMRMQFGIKHDVVPSLTVNLASRFSPYPTEWPLTEDDIVGFLNKIIKGEIKGTKNVSIGQVVNQALRDRITKQIGELVKASE